jgi:hypothetical protein
MAMAGSVAPAGNVHGYAERGRPDWAIIFPIAHFNRARRIICQFV